MKKQSEKKQRTGYTPKFHVPANDVHAELKKYIQHDAFDCILDLQSSSGADIIDGANGKRYLDFFTCVASVPVGFNHPKMLEDDFIRYLGHLALNKPSSSDIYSEELATFVKTFFKLAVPSYFKYSFFVEGGSVAVENAIKVAFDWKVRKNHKKGYRSERGHQIMHFKHAFHGRTGYALSLTNTDPNKVLHFPKFTDWPRIHNPAIKFPLNQEHLDYVIHQEQIAIQEMKQAFFENKDHIAAIITETIQGEGGDNHFRPEFFKAMRELCDENEAMLICDEVQTGVGITGTMWAFEQMDVKPDIFSFGKKMQVCGICVTKRVDEAPGNVFHTPSRINSTWGGNLVDMARATKYLEIIQEENMLANVKTVGKHLMKSLDGLAKKYPDFVSNVRGRGLFCAFDLKDADLRKRVLQNTYKNGLIVLPSGASAIRFRPALNIDKGHVDEGMAIIDKSIAEAIK